MNLKSVNALGNSDAFTNLNQSRPVTSGVLNRFRQTRGEPFNTRNIDFKRIINNEVECKAKRSQASLFMNRRALTRGSTKMTNNYLTVKSVNVLSKTDNNSAIQSTNYY